MLIRTRGIRAGRFDENGVAGLAVVVFKDHFGAAGDFDGLVRLGHRREDKDNE